MKPPAGYSAEELDRDNPFNQWMREYEDDPEPEDVDVDVDEDDGYCDACAGTGEGQYDGASCSSCGGKGFIRSKLDLDDDGLVL